LVYLCLRGNFSVIVEFPFSGLAIRENFICRTHALPPPAKA
jgi:hypothetical protein